ncbi:hypothetical protein Y032_0708g1713 [Ancylostoma ceylanicum]|uniref:Uncharacterized protein n=1 Tax=Ancylostoma ceylanicum TaxID=53326 RepID=A0A016WG44_9BILA|nr:hypothetical protein Y032_0708g1713 [Ancylostoma ceylanicum]
MMRSTDIAFKAKSERPYTAARRSWAECMLPLVVCFCQQQRTRVQRTDNQSSREQTTRARMPSPCGSAQECRAAAPAPRLWPFRVHWIYIGDDYPLSGSS